MFNIMKLSQNLMIQKDLIILLLIYKWKTFQKQ